MKTKISQEILKNSRAVTEDDLKDISIGGNSSDVYLEEYGKTAKELGQIGSAKNLSSGTDLNTIVNPGIYFCVGDDGLNFNHPILTAVPIRLSVFQSDKVIYQHWSDMSKHFERKSIDGGISWDGWMPVGATVLGGLSLYVSKDGDDNNSGLDSDHPLQTIDKAMRIARAITLGGTDSAVFLRLGPGNWGNVNFRELPFFLFITPYGGKSLLEYSDEIPVFDRISFYFCSASLFSVVANELYSAHGSYVVVDIGYKRFGRINASYGSYVLISSENSNTNVIEFIPRSNGTSSVIEVSNNSTIFMDYITLKLAEPLTVTTSFLYAHAGGFLRVRKDRTIFDLNGYGVTGRPYSFHWSSSVAVINDYSDGKMPVWLATVPGNDEGYLQSGCMINGIVYGQVDRYTNQTIGGSKTFVNIPKIKFDTPRIFMEDTVMEKGVVPEQDIFEHISFLDKNYGTGSDYYATSRLGVINYCLRANGNSEIQIVAVQNVADSSTNNSLVVGIPQDSFEDRYVKSFSKIIPGSDNIHSIGQSSLRWSQLYAGTTTIATSDEREKTNFAAVPEEVLDAWGEVNWQQYQFIDAVESKSSEKARLHTGIIAQRIIEVFKKYNLDASKYGLLCHDSWEAEDWDETIIDKEAVVEQKKIIDKPAEYDEEGNEISPEVFHFEDVIIEPEVSHIEHHHRDAGDRYGIRYEEALALEAAYQRRRADRLEQRLLKLEQKLGI